MKNFIQKIKNFLNWLKKPVPKDVHSKEKITAKPRGRKPKRPVSDDLTGLGLTPSVHKNKKRKSTKKSTL